jgi:hypothetical protein
MSTITVHPKDEAQEKALKAIFDAFEIRYEKELDETEYLAANEANKEVLDASVQELESGKGIKVSFDDLWK